MRLARIIVASAFLFGAGCTLPEDGEQGVDPASLDDSFDDQSQAVTSEAMELTADSSEAAIAGDEELLGEYDHWVCWFCYEDKDHDDQALESMDKCPREYCYHGKDKKKNKAKKEARDECEDEHEHGCYFKYCKKFD